MHEVGRHRRVAGRHRRPSQRRLRWIAPVVVTAAIGASTTAVATGAVFNAQSTVPSNTVTTGNVTLALTPAAQTYTVTLAPGETFTTPITVTNSGTAQMRYAVTGTSDGTDNNYLASRMTAQVKTGVTTCTNAGWSGSGTSIAGPTTAASTTGVNIIGNPAQGAQAGDRVLNSGANETLCLQVAMPINVFGGISNKAVTITYQFNAEQTANNP